MGNAALLHELTRPRGERWTWSLEAEQTAGNLSLGVVWERGFTVSPAAWALRGFLALFLVGFALVCDWDGIPWPRRPQRPAQPDVDALYEGPCGCAPPPGVETADGDSTKLVRGLSGAKPPAPAPVTTGAPLP